MEHEGAVLAFTTTVLLDMVELSDFLQAKTDVVSFDDETTLKELNFQVQSSANATEENMVQKTTTMQLRAILDLNMFISILKQLNDTPYFIPEACCSSRRPRASAYLLNYE